MTRIAESQLGFAALELRRQGVDRDPLLRRASSGSSTSRPLLVEHVRRYLAQGLKNPRTGRSGITPPRLCARSSSGASRTWTIARKFVRTHRLTRLFSTASRQKLARRW